MFRGLVEMIKAVIFDLDGTLLNRDASVEAFINSQYERLNNCLGHIPKEKFTSSFIDLDCRGYVWKDKVYQQMINKFKITERTWEKFLQDYLEHFKESCIAFPNLNSMLEGLKRKSIRLGMITNGKGKFQMDNINALNIREYFDVILVSECEGIKKPNPEIFNRALEKLNVLPNQCLFVGDHPINDVKASQAVGMISIWKKDFQWTKVKADFIIDDLAELPLIVEELNLSCIDSY
jgi:putative hydrolase of the HAD superfamily